MRTLEQLREDILLQRRFDNMMKEVLAGREFQVSEEEAAAYPDKLLGYNLVAREAEPVSSGWTIHGGMDTRAMRKVELVGGPYEGVMATIRDETSIEVDGHKYTIEQEQGFYDPD